MGGLPPTADPSREHYSGLRAEGADGRRVTIKKAIIGTTVLAPCQPSWLLQLADSGRIWPSAACRSSHEMMERIAEQGTSKPSVQFKGDCGDGHEGGS